MCLAGPQVINDVQVHRLKATSLENGLYQLDRTVNDSLLRLIFDVFIQLKGTEKTKPL